MCISPNDFAEPFILHTAKVVLETAYWEVGAICKGGSLGHVTDMI